MKISFILRTALLSLEITHFIYLVLEINVALRLIGIHRSIESTTLVAVPAISSLKPSTLSSAAVILPSSVNLILIIITFACLIFHILIDS